MISDPVRARHRIRIVRRTGQRIIVDKGNVKMKRSLLLGTVFAGLVLAGAPLANAGSPDGWYGAVDLGYHKSDKVKVDGVTGADLKLEGGIVGFARLGYRVDPNWRVEFEGGYRPDFANNPGFSGHDRTASAMANLIYDFMPESKLQPFIGGGVGAAFWHVKEYDATTLARSKRVTFAWQGLAGVSAY